LVRRDYPEISVILIRRIASSTAVIVGFCRFNMIVFPAEVYPAAP
jgi:hypothetical protein